MIIITYLLFGAQTNLRQINLVFYKMENTMFLAHLHLKMLHAGLVGVTDYLMLRNSLQNVSMIITKHLSDLAPISIKKTICIRHFFIIYHHFLYFQTLNYLLFALDFFVHCYLQ